MIQRLGELSGKPKDSTLHVYPILNNTSEFGVDDAQISVVTSKMQDAFFKENPHQSHNRYDAAQWHSDIQFEHAPADYTSLRLTKLPSTGGDILWASRYEIYDRFSLAYKRFLEGLTATFVGEGFHKAATEYPDRVTIYNQARGSPLNVGNRISAVHPVVRTNPVSGWKSIFAFGTFPKQINELNDEESNELLQIFKDILVQNHDLQVRFKWRHPNDIGLCSLQFLEYFYLQKFSNLGQS